MVNRLLQGTPLSYRDLLGMAAGLLFIVAALSLASYHLPEKELTRRRGNLAFIPRQTRQAFVARRPAISLGAAAGFGLLVAGWLAAEGLARRWQQTRNRELAQNAILIRLAPRAELRNRWNTAADLWRAVHSTMARPGWQTWLGGGLHLSLEMVQQVGQRLTFYLWIPRPLAQTLMRHLQAAYPGLEVEVLSRQSAGGMADYLDQVGEAAPWAWADLGLAQEAWRPLRTDFTADPLAPVLSTLEGLAAGVELAAVQVIARPSAPGWARGGLQYVSKLRGDALKPGQPRPRLTPQDRALMKAIETKGQSQGYELCLRVMAAGQGDVAGNLERLIRVFDQFGGDNRLAPRKQGDQADLYRLRGRYFPAGWGASAIGETELAALAHLPNREVAGVALEWAGVQIERPSPASFAGPGEKRVVLGMFANVPSFEGGLSGIPYPFAFLRRRLGLAEGSQPDNAAPQQREDGDLPVVGIPLKDARRHFHVIGPTGVGKSTLLLRMIWQYLAHFPDAAVWLQEPHQDLTHKVVMRVPLWREKDVIWLDVMDERRALGINPLDAPAGADIGSLVADVMGVMRKAMGANWDTAVQMQEILENALLAVLRGEQEPTMAHLFKLLTDDNYRYDLTAGIDDPISAAYWQSLEMRKEKELDQMFSVPRRRINAFMRNPVVRRIVAQPRSTVNFRGAIDSGKIILIQLDGRMGGTNRTFIGAMMMYQLFGSIMSRMDIPEEARQQVAICVDEFQTFVGQSGEEFADILEQARKMGASLTLAHQHLGQLGELTNSVANNTGTKVVFRAEAADAPTFLKWLPELSTLEALTKLRNYWCYVRPMVDGSPQPVCTLKTFADPPIPDPAEELRAARRGEPDPLPPHPGQAALKALERMRQMASDIERKAYLCRLPEDGWASYLAARRYHDALRRNQLIENPALIPDKMARIRALVRLGYGTPHYETEARVDALLAI